MKFMWKKISIICLFFLVFGSQLASAQIMGLALSLGNTLASYLFDVYLRNENSFKLDGAPDWYGRNDDPEYDCAFGYMEGSLASVEPAKLQASKNLTAQQERHVRAVLSSEIAKRKLQNEKEHLLVERFKKDPDLKEFVFSNQHFMKVFYEDDEDVRASFVKVCLRREAVIDYQKERLQRITTELSKNRAESAFGELDAQLDQPELDLNTPTEFDSAASKSKNAFEELDQELNQLDN